MFLIAALAVLSASAGPIYLDSADQSVLRTVLQSAPNYDSGLTLTATFQRIFANQPLARVQMQGIDSAAASARNYGLQRWFSLGPRTAVAGVIVLGGSEASGYATDIVARDGACTHLLFIAGHCPGAPYEVALSDRSAAALGVKVADPIAFQFSGQTSSEPLRVVGLYRPLDPKAGYWWGRTFFGFAPGEQSAGRGAGSGGARPHLDSLFATNETVEALPDVAFPSFTQEMPLAVESVHLGDMARIQAALTAYGLNTLQTAQVSMGTGLPSLLTRAGDQQRLMTASVGLVELQLVLLTLFVLYLLVMTASEAREHEVALAKLRGFPLLRVMAVGLLEPVLLLVLAWPVGIALSWLVVRVVASRLLLPGTPVTIGPVALLAAAAALLGGLAATVLGTRSILVRPVVDQLRETRGGRKSEPLRIAADTIAVTLAAAGLLELALSGALRGDQTDPLAVIAPGLVGVAAAILGIRLLPALSGPALRFTANSRFVGGFLAIRQVIRRRGVLRQILLICPAVGLATFAVTGFAIADRNRSTRAAFEVGASRVLIVVVAPDADLTQAVRAADPGGRSAMAAVQHHSSVGDVLAVDAGRLAAVSAWAPQIASRNVAGVVRWLLPPTAPPVDIRGSELRLTLDDLGTTNPPHELEATIAKANASRTVLDLGTLVHGPHSYLGALPAGCSAGCRLVGLRALTSLSTSNLGATFSLVLTGVDTRSGGNAPWQPVDAGLDTPGRWRSDLAGVQISEDASASPGLLLTFSGGSESLATVVPADLPARLPGVVTSDQIAFNGNGDDTAIGIEGIDGNALLVDGRVHSTALPRIGNGVLLDLTLAERSQLAPAAQDSVEEVWLSPNADNSLVARLQSQGLQIVGQEFASDVKSRLDREGTSLAFDFFIFAAGAAVVIATGAVVLTATANSRRRTLELALLRSFGIPRRTLFRALVGEQAVVLGSGMILGIAAGLAGVLIALPSVPQFVDEGAGPPLDYGVPLGALAGFIVLVFLLLAGTAVVVAIGLLRASGAARPRSG